MCPKPAKNRLHLALKRLCRCTIGTFCTVFAMATNLFPFECRLIHAQPNHSSHVIQMIAESVGVRRRAYHEVKQPTWRLLKNVRMKYLAPQSWAHSLRKFVNRSHSRTKRTRKLRQGFARRCILFTPHIPGVRILLGNIYDD